MCSMYFINFLYLRKTWLGLFPFSPKGASASNEESGSDLSKYFKPSDEKWQSDRRLILNALLYSPNSDSIILLRRVRQRFCNLWENDKISIKLKNTNLTGWEVYQASQACSCPRLWSTLWFSCSIWAM